MNALKLALNNIIKRPLKSLIIVVIEMALTVAVFGTLLIDNSLETGLTSLRDRLGADIIVVPKDVNAVNNYQSIVLNHNTDYFFFDESAMSELYSYVGVSKITKQLFLASASASCCTSKVEIIGYDPETDFIVSPWINNKLQQSVKGNQVVVGSALNILPGEHIKFYGVDCIVVGKMEPTGTSYDFCAFAEMNTVKNLVKGSIDKDLNKYKNVNPDTIVSCVMLKVDNEKDIDTIASQINLTSPNFTALTNMSLTRSTAKNIEGMKNVFRFLLSCVCALVVATLFLLYFFVYSEREKDFAILKMLGIKRHVLIATSLAEVIYQALVSTALGVLAVLGISFVLGPTMREWLSVPVLLPSVPRIITYAVITCIISMSSCIVSSALYIINNSRVSISIALKES